MSLPPRVGFLMEQALGHVTYAKNLQAAYASGGRITPYWMPAPFECGGALDRAPGVRANWTVRGSVRAYAALRAAGGPSRFDAVLYHTQTIALSAPLTARRAPVILSFDATPANFDSIGIHYGHTSADSRAERVKRAIHRRVFASASALTTWSQWAKDSLRDDYGVDPERVTVIAPGVDLSLFPFGTLQRPSTDRPVRVLFVGGDFDRKGGQDLIAWYRSQPTGRCHLDLVTKAAVPALPGLTVHRDLGPNDPRLLALYRDADIFALPTYADCLAVVLGEAMAAGLPIVTTTVGAQPEAVRDGHTGLIVQPGDGEALGRALERLIQDPHLRHQMGHAGRATAEARFDARINLDRLIDVIEAGIDRWHGRALARAAAA